MEIIKTDRFILRKPTKSDTVSLLLLLNDKEIEEYVPNLYFDDIKQIKKFMRYYIRLCDSKNDFCLIIEDSKTKNIVGIIDAYLYDSKNIMTISYVVKKSTRGQGIMPEALKAFLLYLYKNSIAKFAEFSIRNYNYSSLKVMEKLNISPYKEKRGYIYYRLSLQEKPSF